MKTSDIQIPLKVHYLPTLLYGVYFFHMRRDVQLKLHTPIIIVIN